MAGTAGTQDTETRASTLAPAYVRRLVGIEGLRAIAASSVVVTHVWNLSAPDGGKFDFGWLSTYVLPKMAHGVTLFFTLSGFLLYLPFAAAILGTGPRPSFPAYLRNRALRIFPAYWVVFFATALILQSARVHQAQGGIGIDAITDSSLLLENALLVHNYSPSSVSTGITPAWSLAVEVVFYAALPLLVLAGGRIATTARTTGGRAVRLAAPAVLLGLVGILSVVLGPRAGSRLEADFTWSRVWEVSFMTHAHLFALGMILAVVHVEYHSGRLRLPAGWRAAAWAGSAGLVVTGVILGGSRTVPERVEIALVAAACALLLALVVLHRPAERPAVVRVLERRSSVALGVASYSIYLWHVPVTLLLLKHGVTQDGGVGALLVNLSMVAAVTGSLSWVTYRFVEKPALRHKARAVVWSSPGPASQVVVAPSGQRAGGP